MPAKFYTKYNNIFTDKVFPFFVNDLKTIGVEDPFVILENPANYDVPEGKLPVANEDG